MRPWFPHTTTKMPQIEEHLAPTSGYALCDHSCRSPSVSMFSYLSCAAHSIWHEYSMSELSPCWTTQEIWVVSATRGSFGIWNVAGDTDFCAERLRESKKNWFPLWVNLACARLGYIIGYSHQKMVLAGGSYKVGSPQYTLAPVNHRHLDVSSGTRSKKRSWPGVLIR